MAHELGCAFAQRSKRRGEGVLGKRASQAQSQKMIRHLHGVEVCETEIVPVREWTEGPPHIRDVELLGEPNNDAEDLGNDMSVFMRIQMRNA